MKSLNALSTFLKSRGMLDELTLLEKISIANRTHTVESGDIIGTIAEEYNVSETKLMSMNGLEFTQGTKDVHLSLGQVLKVPAARVQLNSAKSPSTMLTEWMKFEEGGNGAKPYDYDCSLALPNSGEPYLCSYKDGRGNWTIGWGRNQKTQSRQTITKADAEKFLAHDLAEAASGLSSSIKGIDETRISIPIALNQGQFDALTSLIFNAGRKSFKDSSLYNKYIKLGKIGKDYSDGISAEFMSFRVGADQGGLVGRRERELGMFLRGEYTNK